MSKKHRPPPTHKPADVTSPEGASPPGAPASFTQDDLDGESLAPDALPADLKPAEAGGGADLRELDDLADADPDAPPDLPALPAVEAAPEAPLDGMQAPPTPDAPEVPPATSERLEDAVAGVDPAEPSTATPNDLPASNVAAPTTTKGKKSGAKKSGPEALFGDAEAQCERASAASMIGPFFDLFMAALPVYFGGPAGMGWSDVLMAAQKMVVEHGAKYGATPLDLNPAALADGFGALMAGGPDVFLVKTLTVYQLEPTPDTMPTAAMPGTLPLPDSFNGRRVLGQRTVAVTPGMAIVYNLTEKGSALVGPVLEALFNFLAKHADLARPIAALAIGAITGYRMWRDTRTTPDILVRHQPETVAPSA
jgi:hypothetical protein